MGNPRGASPRTVVLVGAGHAHLHVAARAETFVARGVRVVLVDPGVFWYSGLATGMLGGRYEPGADQVDPRSLIESRGGEFFCARVDAVETAARRLRLEGGGELQYDYLSLNVGSVVESDTIDGAAGDPTVWTVKPISLLWKLREQLEAAFREGVERQVAVVGGGPTGCEVAANLRALAARRGAPLKVTLLTPHAGLAPQGPAAAARFLERKLKRLGVVVHTHARAVRRSGDHLITEDGRRLPADRVVLATGLQPAPLVDTLGLPTAPRHGLRVNAHLQSVADVRVFACGDCAALEGHALPKLGVFGVRQAKTLHRNLLASVDASSLSNYTPQKRFLAILNLGDGTGLSTWGSFWWQGRSSMWLKDLIDQRFLRRYRAYYR